MAHNDDDYLEKVKSQVRSVLISCPDRKSELNKFLKDYESTIGKPLPFKDFNYRTPIQFLSSLTDVVNICDSAHRGIELSPVVTQLSGHISQFVNNQKKSKSAPKYSRPKVFAPRRNPPVPNPQRVNNSGGPSIPAFPSFMHHNGGWWPIPQGFYPYNSHSFVPQNNNLNAGQGFGPNNSTFKVKPLFPECNAKPLFPECNAKVSSAPTKVAKFGNNVTNIPFRKEGKFSDENDTNLKNFQCKRNDDEKVVFDKKQNEPRENRTHQYSISCLSSDSVKKDNLEDQMNKRQNLDLTELSDAISVLGCGEKATCSEVTSDKINGLCRTMKTKIWRVLENYSNGISSTSFMNLFECVHSQPLNLTALGYSSLKEMVMKNEDLFCFKKDKDSDDWILYDARVKPRRRQSEDSFDKWIPHNVADNLAALAIKYPKGIHANYVLESYKEQFGTEINPENLGFSDLRTFLENCKSVHYQFTADGGVVYPKTTGLTNPSLENCLEETALPPPEKIKFMWKEHFKENECDPSDCFKPAVIPDKKCIQVKVSEVSSPALFWLQLIEDAMELNTLMLQLNTFYDEEEANYQLPFNLVLPKLVVAALFMNRWHRALINKVSGGVIEVMYVDYGTIVQAKLEHLRKLDRRFMVDRIHCIKASLFGLIPYNGDEWPFESCTYLYDQWGDKIVFAEVHSINYQMDYQESSVSVSLYDTSKNNEIDIAKLLVEQKLAKFMVSPESVLNETTVSKFQKFLPRWFSCSQTNDSDLHSCLENLLVCTNSNCEPLDANAIPCCKIHCLKKFFLAKPELVAVIWEKAYKLEEERILNHMLHQVKVTLVELGWWNFCVNSPSFCYGQSPLERNTVDIRRDRYSSPNHLIGTSHSKSGVNLCLENEETVDELKTKLSPSPHFPRPDSSLAPIQSKPSATNGSHNLDNHFSFGTAHPLVSSFPRVIKYLNTSVNNSKLIVMYFEDNYRVSLHQLFAMSKDVPKMLADIRLSVHQHQFKLYRAKKMENPYLYADLMDLGLTLLDEEPVLVLFRDAPKVLHIIDPTLDWDVWFKDLATQILNNFNHMISPVS